MVIDGACNLSRRLGPPAAEEMPAHEQRQAREHPQREPEEPRWMETLAPPAFGQQPAAAASSQQPAPALWPVGAGGLLDLDDQIGRRNRLRAVGDQAALADVDVATPFTTTHSIEPLAKPLDQGRRTSAGVRLRRGHRCCAQVARRRRLSVLRRAWRRPWLRPGRVHTPMLGCEACTMCCGAASDRRDRGSAKTTQFSFQAGHGATTSNYPAAARRRRGACRLHVRRGRRTDASGNEVELVEFGKRQRRTKG